MGAAPRVIHSFNTLNSGGLQRVVLALAKWSASEAGVQSILVSAGGPLEDELPLPGARWVRKDSRLGLISEVRQLRALIRDFRPDVIHAHQRHDALVSHIAVWGTSVRVVEHAHNTLPNINQKILSFRSRTIFAVSDEVKQMIVTSFGRDPSRINVIGGVPFNTAEEPPRPRASKEPRVILGIGRLEEQKDPERFVRVIAEAAKLGPVEARWLGAGSLDGACKRLATTLKAPVTFVGESRDVVGELDRADGLLITSRWEGLGLVILEAFARQRPVVGLAEGGMGSLLSDGRGTALAAGSSDAALASAVWAGTAFNPEVDESVARAHEYAQTRASADAVYGPVVREYARGVRNE